MNVYLNVILHRSFPPSNGNLRFICIDLEYDFAHLFLNHSENETYFTKEKVIDMQDYLIHNICVDYGGR